MSCDLITSCLQDFPVLMSDAMDNDSTPSSGHHSCAEDGDFSSVSEGPVSKDCDQDKDSGIEFCGEDSSQPLEGLSVPDEELMKGIIDMVEFYFSDANLLKDTFLLKHVRRNKEGYVSLKLITNFRKVKTFTRDWKVVAYSLKHSQLMQVNEQCTKVRRKQPLPLHDETQSSRTVLVTGLPSTGSVDTGALELVASFGDLLLVRLIKPADVTSSSEQHKDLKKFLSRRPELEGTACVLVEFSRQESAAKAVKEINASGCNYTAYSLADKTSASTQKPTAPVPIININNNVNKQQAVAKKNRKGAKKQPTVSKNTDSSDSEHQFSPELRRRSSGSCSSGYYSSSPRFTESFERRSGRSVSLSTGTGATRPLPVIRPRTRLDTAPALASGLSADASPWVQRRIAARPPTQPCVIVLREPRGPDGSAGFQPRIAICS